MAWCSVKAQGQFYLYFRRYYNRDVFGILLQYSQNYRLNILKVGHDSLLRKPIKLIMHYDAQVLPTFAFLCEEALFPGYYA